MFNVKDTPEAAGYMLLTAGFIALTWLGPTPTTAQRVLGWLAVAAGTVISVGVRPGIWPGIALAVAGVGILVAWLGSEPRRRIRTTVLRLGLVVSAIAAGYAVLALVYPYLFGNPLLFAFNSFKASSDFPHETYVLFDGELNGMPPRWYYLPKLLLAQLPEVMIVMIVGTSLFAGWLLVKKIRNRHDTSLDHVIPALGFTLVHAAAFPIAAILLNATIYGGIRQFLFIIPALVVIGTIGLFLITRYLSTRKAIRSTRLVAGLMVFSVSLTTFSATQMYPYVSDYFNPTNVARGIDNRWDVDRWRMGFWETYNQLPIEAQERCLNTGGVDRPCWDLDQLLIRKPTTPISGTAEIPLRANESIQIGWMREVSSNCRIVGGISRPYLWTSISLDTVRACDYEVNTYTPEPRGGTVQNRRWWKNHTAWGWANSSLGSNGVVSLPRQSASVGFGLTEQMLTSDVQIHVSLSLVPRDEKFPLFVNVFANDVLGTTVKLRDDERRDLTFTVSSKTLTSLDVDSLFVAFTVVDGSGDRVASGINVHSISVRPIRNQPNPS
jgi:hypothetical protein